MNNIQSTLKYVEDAIQKVEVNKSVKQLVTTIGGASLLPEQKKDKLQGGSTVKGYKAFVLQKSASVCTESKNFLTMERKMKKK